MQIISQFGEDCRRLREVSPLVHNITNYVAMNLSANALLAVGASPLMSSEPLEMEELSSLCDSLVINTGCIESGQLEAMRIAAGACHTKVKPWVLDPAGAGASRLRTDTALELVSEYHPSVVRCNASEIITLDGKEVRSRGVDSAASCEEALDSAKHFAAQYGTVVSVSGESDLVTDGTSVFSISNGTPLMARVTGMGCTASALTAAFAAVDRNFLSAAVCAMALIGVVGEMAALESAGPGSFSAHFLDILASIGPTEAAGRINCRLL